MKYAAITASASGNTVVITAVAGKKIRILDYLLTTNAAVNVTWKSSGGSSISGILYLGTNAVVTAVGGYQLAGGLFGLFETLPDEGLTINLSGSVAVGGHITYSEVAV